MKFQDYFSDLGNRYAEGRPQYPDELFQFLVANVPATECVWDSGTGNGQAAVSLSKYFKKVIATDASESQLKNAFQVKNIEYKLAKSEETGIASHSVDLVTAAAAVHWFDLEKYYSEVKRILKPGGIVAVWSYVDNRSNTDVDPIIHQLGHETLWDYWPKERANVWNKYADLYFPFENIPAPEFKCKAQWNLVQLVNYLNTWSSTQQYVKAHKTNPVEPLIPAMEKAWGDPRQVREVTWDLGLRVGRVS